MFVVSDSFVLWIKLCNNLLKIGHFLDLTCNVWFVSFKEFLLWCVIFKNESYLLVLFLQRNDFLNHFFVDYSNSYRILPVSEVVLKIQGIGVILNEYVVFVSDILDFILFRVLDHQDNQVTIKSLFDLFNLIVTEKLDILWTDVWVHIELGNLVFFD